MSRRKLTSSRWHLPILIEFRANSQTISYPATCRKSNFIPPLFSTGKKKKKINTQLFKMILQWRVPLEPQKHTAQVTALDQHSLPGQHNWQSLDGFVTLTALPRECLSVTTSDERWRCPNPNEEKPLQ